MENKKLIVVYKEVGKEPVAMKIDDTLEIKEKLVGGKLEVIPYENVFICFNEEFQKKTIKPNIVYKFGSICGNCFVVNKDKYSGNLKSLTKEQVIQYYKNLKKNGFTYRNYDENGRMLTKSEIRKKRQLEQLNLKTFQGQKKYNEINYDNSIKVVEINDNNTNKTSENAQIEDKNKNITNLSNKENELPKFIIEKSDSSSKCNENDEQLLKMILGIQGMILKFIKAKMDENSNDESES